MVLTRYQHYTKAVLNHTDELFTVLQRVKLGVFTLKKCVNAFNDIFGWTTLGSVFCSTFKCFVYIDVASKHSEVVEMWWGTEGDQLHFLCEIGFIAVMWVSVLAPYLDNSVIALFQTGIVLTIFLSDKILNEFDNLLDLAWQRKGLNPHLDKEFKLFVSFVECNRPRFTAARFFAIDRSTLFKIINSSIGFFLVMIQSY
jgi:gustatory receptor